MVKLLQEQNQTVGAQDLQMYYSDQDRFARCNRASKAEKVGREGPSRENASKIYAANS